MATTRPLYPLYGAGGGAGGSFDDMSIGLGESADELSDLGSQGASVLGSRASGGGPSPTRSRGSPQRRGLGAAPLASSEHDGSARDGSDAPSYPSSRPSHNDAYLGDTTCETDENGGGGDGGSYVGDVLMDSADVSAILGTAPTRDEFDEESLLQAAGGGVLPERYGIRISDAERTRETYGGGGTLETADFGLATDGANGGYSGHGGGGGNPDRIADVSAMRADYDNYPTYDASSDSSSYDSLEDGLYRDDGILPGWLAGTSRWTKAVVVLGASVAFGALVLGTVAVVASVTQSGDPGGAEEARGPNAVEGWSPVPPGVGEGELARLDLAGGRVPTGSPIGASEETGEGGGEGSGWIGFGIEAPTPHPTTAGPTDAPTDEPAATESPAAITGSPTAAVTATPSGSPTATPPPTATSSPSGPATESPSPTAVSSSSPSDAPTAAPTATSSPSWELGPDASDGAPLTFFLMADSGNNVPYWSDRLARLRVEEHSYLFHLGSATRGVDNCTESSYNDTATSLSSSPLPAWSVPGNRDWLGCPDPDAAWERYERHFVAGLDARRGNATDGLVVRRQPGRAENYAFVSSRVLFVGLNAVTNADAGNATHDAGRWEDNVSWLRSNVDAHSPDAVRAVFVMGYGRLLDPSARPLRDALAGMKGEGGALSGTTVVYARRAGDGSELVRDVDGTEGLHELRVGSGWPIVDVKVEPDGGTLGPEGEALVGWRLALDPEGGGGKDGPK